MREEFTSPSPSVSGRSRRQSVALVALLAHLTCAGDLWAADDDTRKCSDAYVRGQEARIEEKLRVARDQLLTCAQRTCPSFMQAECAKWLTEVEAALPTIVIDAKSER